MCSQLDTKHADLTIKLKRPERNLLKIFAQILTISLRRTPLGTQEIPSKLEKLQRLTKDQQVCSDAKSKSIVILTIKIRCLPTLASSLMYNFLSKEASPRAEPFRYTTKATQLISRYLNFPTPVTSKIFA